MSARRSLGPVADMAAKCHGAHLPGLVWLDSAVAGRDSCSVVAACPEILLRGTAVGWQNFENHLAAFQQEHPGGAAVGFVEYDGGFLFGFYTQPLLYRHGREQWSFPGGVPAWYKNISGHRVDGPGWRVPLKFVFETPRSEFCGWVESARIDITAGNIYQVNLAHRAYAEWPAGADTFALYLRLRTVSPAPQAAYLALDASQTVLCSSPEEFLMMRGSRVQTRPIKGTRPRGRSEADDQRAAAELLDSEKERAELLMITDLLRNDLGQVCEYGSVEVRDLFRVEPFTQVFHLVSTIQGRLRPGVTHARALRMCSPGGSITGAPKRRARSIIASLENAPRGLYTGSIGAFLPGGESRFNVAIRTLIVEGGHAHFHVGAGIVADSDPALEWEETLHKAAGILQAAEGRS